MTQVRVLAGVVALLGAGGLLLGKSRMVHSQIAYGGGPVFGPEGALPLSQPVSARASSDEPLPAREAAEIKAHSLMAGLPLMFEPNQGQANLDASDPRVKFIARGAGYVLALGSEGAIVTVRARRSSQASGFRSLEPAQFQTVRMRLAGANAHARIDAIDALPSKSNYLLGNDPAKWRRGVPQFARVRYQDIYPGINLVFYGNQGHLEHDFQVAPGADPSQAQLQFDGAERLELDNGALRIRLRDGELRLEAPRVYQRVDGREQTVSAHYVLRGTNRASFAVGPYDRTRELVIDPVLNFSSYFGGSGDELATSVAIDGAGFIYLTGSTDSTLLPTAGTSIFQTSLKSTPPAANLYIVKLFPTNVDPLVYVTYLGGTGSDTPAPFGGIAVDGAGDAYVAGTTTSTDFPTTTTAYQTTPISSGQHVFVAELNTTASALNYSSYLSGNGTESASGMTIDTAADIYVTGTTSSSNTANPTGTPPTQFPASGIPAAQAYQGSSKGGALQFFVTKVDTAGVGVASIAYSTYFGGGSFTGSGLVPCSSISPGSTVSGLVACGGGIAVDTNLNIYFSGTTNFLYTGQDSGTDFPILNAYEYCLDSLPPATYTYAPTCIYNSGSPAPSATDAFVAKLTNPNGVGVLVGQQLQWSTYLGGSANDFGNGIAIDPGAANVYLVGTTNSTDFVTHLPTVTGQFQSTPGCASCGLNDAFVARFPNLTPTSTTLSLALAYFSYLGGSGNDAGLAIVADNTNGALVTGYTLSADFPFYPPTGAIQSQLCPTVPGCPNGTQQDAFEARLNTVVPPGANNKTGSYATYFGGGTSDTSGVMATTQGSGIALDSNQNVYFAGSTNTTDLQETVTTPPLNTNQGGYDAFVTQLRAAPAVSIYGVATLGTNQTFFPAGNPATFTYTITNNGQDPAYNLIVIDNLQPANSNSNVTVTFDSASSTAGSCGTVTTNGSVSCTIGSLQPGSIATVTFVITPMANNSGTPAGFTGGQVSVIGQNNITLAVTEVPAQMSDFGITAFPSNVSVAAGQTATYQVQLTPHPVFGTNVSLSCTGVPTSASCNFTPNNSISLQGSSPASATLNLTTTAQTIITASSKSEWRRFYGVFLGVPGLALVGIGFGGDRRRRWRLTGLFLALLVMAQLLSLPGCSTIQTQPPPTGTPSGQYQITLTATSGSDTKNIPIQLTVTPSP